MTMNINKKNLFIYIVPLLLLIIDQLIKFLVLKKMPDQGIFLIQAEKLELAIRLVKNTNLAFSIPLPSILIYIIIIALVLVLSYLLYRAVKNQKNLIIFCLLLIILGAISNLFDRIVHGAVIDFVSIKIFSWQLAVFNLADVWIVLGVAILFIKEPFKIK